LTITKSSAKRRLFQTKEFNMRKFIFWSLGLLAITDVMIQPQLAANHAPPADEAKPAAATKSIAAGPNKAEAKFLSQMAEVIRLFGYDCARVDHAYPQILSRGFDVFCTGRHGTLYEFSLEDHGGKWRVTAD
jgi:hypothetical protein